MYKISSSNTPTSEKQSPTLFKYSKNFSKKRIVQIAVIPDYNLLILLTGIKNNCHYYYLF